MEERQNDTMLVSKLAAYGVNTLAFVIISIFLKATLSYTLAFHTMYTRVQQTFWDVGQNGKVLSSSGPNLASTETQYI